MTRATPLVSIGLPVFNGADYIRRALDSLLAQNYANLEINICDNASTDRTEEICRAYSSKDRRVRYRRNASNLGILPNWRLTLDLASGDYFMWAAHDDWWSENYIETLLGCLSSEPKAALAAGKTIYVDAMGDVRNNMEPDRAPAKFTGSNIDAAKQLLVEHATNWLHGLYSTDRLRQASSTFFTENPWGSDVLFLLQLSLSHEIVGSDDAIIYKRVSAQQRFAPKTPKERVKWQCYFTRALMKVILDSPLRTKEKVYILGIYISYLKWLYFRHGLYSWTKLWLRAGYQCLRERSIL